MKTQAVKEVELKQGLKLAWSFILCVFWIETGVKDGTDRWVTVAEPPFGHKSIGSHSSLRQNAAEAVYRDNKLQQPFHYSLVQTELHIIHIQTVPHGSWQLGTCRVQTQYKTTSSWNNLLA